MSVGSINNSLNDQIIAQILLNQQLQDAADAASAQTAQNEQNNNSSLTGGFGAGVTK